ncbi:Apoptosis-inducing factor 1 [Tieghemiomyces parasiticus]|uniref:Apoptosis-inducing factor 1 n=1 Tax=Tieghemiomyces parasiticus TaxID=78921 RepID=A0A9W8DJN8_9FUNG|nr:Apoptosis-inducing factor 1 [Tieghemiomyces parasiticus]
MAPTKHLVCTVHDVQEGEKKEFTVEGQTILLAKLQGQIYAVSSHCTHYGAPLANGVLSANGCLTCPWHGACFNVKTGDIEDAPALDPLVSFPVTVANGTDVYIEATADDLKADRRHYTSCGSQVRGADAGRVVIVGNGSSGLATAEALRQVGYRGAIDVIGKEPYLPIDRPKLSKAFDPALDKIALRTTEKLAKQDIQVRTGTTVTGVDTQRNQVTLESGEQIKYNHLVLATGGSPRSLPLPGVDLDNVFTLRTHDNAHAIAAALRERAGVTAGDDADAQKDKLAQVKFVIIGSSFIGLEYASVARQQGADVAVVGVEDIPFARVLGPQIGKALTQMHRDQGVRFHLKAQTTALHANLQRPGQVGSLELKSGERIPADVVLIAVGVAPNTEWLRGSGVPVQDDGAINVDTHLRVEGLTNVYAAGDIAKHPYWLQDNHPVRIEHWNVAQNLGRCVATNIAGTPEPYRHVPYFWTAQYGKSLRYCGHATDYDDVIILGNVAEGKWAAFYTKKDKVLAVASLNYDPIVSKSAQLLNDGQMPPATDIRNGTAKII